MSDMAIFRQLSRMPVAAALGLRQQDCRQSSSDNQIDAKSCRAYSRAASVGRLCLTVCFPFLISSGSLKPHSCLDCSLDSTQTQFRLEDGGRKLSIRIGVAATDTKCGAQDRVLQTLVGLFVVQRQGERIYVA